MSKIKKLMITALCVALGVIVPMAFHSIQNAGVVFCPMHIPILICALVCGWKYGLMCGVLAPILSSFITGMPAVGVLPFLTVEFAVYGVVAGLVMDKIKTKNIYADLYISLIVAMLAGRVVSGLVKAIVLTNGYSIATWLTASFVTCLPGILIQMVLIPNLIMVLIKSNLIPNKYTRK